MALHYVVESNLDAPYVKDARKEFEYLACCGQDVVMDLTSVDHLDSSCVGAIVFVLKRLRATGRNLKVINAKGQPQQIIKELGLSRGFGAH